MKAHKDSLFQGVWPAMFTPVNNNGDLNPLELEKLIELLISEDVDGLYLLGSTGQGFLFNEEERKEIAALSLEIINGRLPVIVQVGALSTDESVRLAKHAAANGANGISSVGPIYYAASALMGVEHYTRIAQSTNLPFFPYQIGNAIMNNDVIGKLLELPNIAGLKLTTANLLEISSIHHKTKGAWRLFSGADELLCQAAMCGTVGAIGTTYNLAGSTCKYVRQEFLNGNVELGIEFMLYLQELIENIIPVVWSFFNRAMKLKYGITIGEPKAPLLARPLPWNDDEILAMVNGLDKYKMSANVVVST